MVGGIKTWSANCRAGCGQLSYIQVCGTGRGGYVFSFAYTVNDSTSHVSRVHRVPSYSHGPGDPELSLQVSLPLHARPKRNRVPLQEWNLHSSTEEKITGKQARHCAFFSLVFEEGTKRQGDRDFAFIHARDTR